MEEDKHINNSNKIEDSDAGNRTRAAWVFLSENQDS